MTKSSDNTFSPPIWHFVPGGREALHSRATECRSRDGRAKSKNPFKYLYQSHHSSARPICHLIYAALLLLERVEGKLNGATIPSQVTQILHAIIVHPEFFPASSDAHEESRPKRELAHQEAPKLLWLYFIQRSMETREIAGAAF